MGVHLGTLQLAWSRLPFNRLSIDALPFELVPVPVVLGACAPSLNQVAAVLLLPAVPAASQNTNFWASLNLSTAFMAVLIACMAAVTACMVPLTAHMAVLTASMVALNACIGGAHYST